MRQGCENARYHLGVSLSRTDAAGTARLIAGGSGAESTGGFAGCVTASHTRLLERPVSVTFLRHGFSISCFAFTVYYYIQAPAVCQAVFRTVPGERKTGEASSRRESAERPKKREVRRRLAKQEKPRGAEKYGSARRFYGENIRVPDAGATVVSGAGLRVSGWRRGDGRRGISGSYRRTYRRLPARAARRPWGGR